MTRLETLQGRLQQYLDCEAAILSGAQEYNIGNRRRGSLMLASHINPPGRYLRYHRPGAYNDKLKASLIMQANPAHIGTVVFPAGVVLKVRSSRLKPRPLCHLGRGEPGAARKKIASRVSRPA